MEFIREVGTDVSKPVVEHATVSTTNGAVTVTMELPDGKALTGSLPSNATEDEIQLLVEALEQAAAQLA